MACESLTAGSSGEEICSLLNGVGNGVGVLLSELDGPAAVFFILLAAVAGAVAIFFAIAARVRSGTARA
jgi:hypothetical protein